MVRDLKEKVILGVPFWNTIYLIRVDNQGTKLLDEEILFEFANPPNERNINESRDQAIEAKENHINSLSQEISSKKIEDQLEVKKTQDVIERFKKRITNEFCLNILNAFWHRK